MWFKAKVVRQEDGLYFEFENGFLVDTLHADLLKNGKLTIFRNGRALDETKEVVDYGTHCSTFCFLGLTKLFDENSDPRAYAIDVFRAKWLQERDVIQIETDDFNSVESFTERVLHRYKSLLSVRDNITYEHQAGNPLRFLRD